MSTRVLAAARPSFVLVLAALLLAFALPSAPTPAAAQAEHPLTGLWEAAKIYGPWARGELVVRREGGAWSGEIAGHRGPAAMTGGEIVFDLPSRGHFRGRQVGSDLRGYWVPPWGPGQTLSQATPVVLTPDGRDQWSGEVRPVDDRFTFYLLIAPQPDGKLTAYLRNPDRDLGAQWGVRRIELDGERVRLMGRRSWQPEEREIARGSWDAENQVLSINIPGRGGTYDFRRAGDGSDFYPRGRNPGRYVYRRPPERPDGWRTSTLPAEGVDQALIERAVQALLDQPFQDYATPRVEALLVARNGKLVLEEYFHGLDRDRLHETRSASKVLATTLAGAVMQAGGSLRLSSPVYQVMNGGTFPEGLEPRKRAMTLDHLLTMSSGYYCDDNDDNAPGNENKLQDERDEKDFWRYSLTVPMAYDPGQVSIYCSMNPNLALGMVARSTGESPLHTFDRLIAGPMRIERWGWYVDRASNAYGGGGVRLRPRDFLKIGQMMLDGGTWEGRRILSRDFVAAVTTMDRRIGERPYGRLWWGFEWPWRGRTVKAYAALGAGGQNIIVVPELNLVIGSFSSNYVSPGAAFNTDEQTPNRLLPAVAER